MVQAYEVWMHGVKDLVAECSACRCLVPFRTGCYQPVPARIHYVRAYCPSCGCFIAGHDLTVIAMSTPEGRAFWRENPRIRKILPEPEIEADGVPAVVLSWMSLSGPAKLDVVIGRESCEIIHVSRR